MDKDRKKLLRETKRQIKKDGNRSRRRFLKRQLEDDPYNAHLQDDSDYDYKYDSSTWLNGIDNDATRKKKEREDYDHYMNGRDNEEDSERY